MVGCQSSDGQGDHGKHATTSLSLDETGESTRSLLPILSHSRIKDSPDDVSRSSNVRPQTQLHGHDRGLHRPLAQRSQTECCGKSSRYSLPKTSDSHSTSTSQTTSNKVSQLTPWEKWLIEKTKQERKRVKEKAKLQREKQLKIAEEKKMKVEKAKVIEVKVNMWIEERTTKEQESRKANWRLEKTKKQLEAEEKRGVQEKAKGSDVP
ncbi:coiled-coil domain-containing protein 34-like [Strongylocentrotus purpuratus]|uniref:Uncharacterized protein n=1 Tax=Strongylocentrotus purpuratus TaxID=7668 RepID=A0A7M7T319_STRPU|nr:coiled-coil domain-containing protein 34-like [Strongylocentrotus purpuratus]